MLTTDVILGIIVQLPYSTRCDRLLEYLLQDKYVPVRSEDTCHNCKYIAGNRCCVYWDCDIEESVI